MNEKMPMDIMNNVEIGIIFPRVWQLGVDTISDSNTKGYPENNCFLHVDHENNRKLFCLKTRWKSILSEGTL